MTLIKKEQTLTKEKQFDLQKEELLNKKETIHKVQNKLATLCNQNTLLLSQIRDTYQNSDISLMLEEDISKITNQMYQINEQCNIEKQKINVKIQQLDEKENNKDKKEVKL